MRIYRVGQDRSPAEYDSVRRSPGWRRRARVWGSHGQSIPASGRAAGPAVHKAFTRWCFALPRSFVGSQIAIGAKDSKPYCHSSGHLGRLRRATEGARATLLSTEENRKAVVTTLVSDVATAYITLRELDYELEIARGTLETRRTRCGLFNRVRAGCGDTGDLRQAEELVDTAAQLSGAQQQAEQTENQISSSAWREPAPGDPQGRFNEDCSA